MLWTPENLQKQNVRAYPFKSIFLVICIFIETDTGPKKKKKKQKTKAEQKK